MLDVIVIGAGPAGVVAALRAGDLSTVGVLFQESHRSLRDDYEVSVPDLDRLVELACRQERVFGARLTGGGFGGAVVALAARDSAAAAGAAITRHYVAATGNPGRLIVPNFTER